MNRMTGEQSICFEKPPYIRCSASVVGKKEGEGPLGNLFDLICEDPMLGEENWEKAESMLQVKAAKLVLEKAGQMPQRVRYIFAGDLLGQLIATSFGVFDLWGDALSGSDDSKCRLCRPGAGNHLQSFRKCGKTVPFSSGIWKPETALCDLDRDRKRSVSVINRKESCKDHRHHDRKSG